MDFVIRTPPEWLLAELVLKKLDCTEPAAQRCATARDAQDDASAQPVSKIARMPAGYRIRYRCCLCWRQRPGARPSADQTLERVVHRPICY